MAWKRVTANIPVSMITHCPMTTEIFMRSLNLILFFFFHLRNPHASYLEKSNKTFLINLLKKCKV